MAVPVLVVENGGDGGGAIRRAVRAERFSPSAAETTDEALAYLSGVDPLLAVLDWEVVGGAGASDVLGHLANEHPSTVTIVVSRSLGEMAVRRTISWAHPGALIQDRQVEPDALRLRIRGAVGRPFADLIVRKGRVVHVPCGLPFRHWVAAQLVVGRGRPVLARRATGPYCAARRFSAFLRDHGSPVRVAVYDQGFKHLVESGTPSPCRFASAVGSA